MRTAKEILEAARVIAVVGCSAMPTRDSHRIAAYLQRQGYRIIPVNPTIDSTLGETAYPDLQSVPHPIDLVNVFRRSSAVPGVVDDAIAAHAPAIWLQLGVSDDAAEETARRAGLDVIADQCIAVEYRLLGVRGPRERA